MAVWSVVNYSYAFPKSRIDPEFYQPRHLELEKILSKACATKEKIRDVAYEIPEQYKRTQSEHLFQYNDISSVDINSGKIAKNILRMKDAPGRAVFINQKDDVLISTVRPNRNANTIIEDLDILQVGSNGFCNLRALNIDPNYLFVFSKTKYFRDYLVRFSKSSMYPAVANSDVFRFPFFRPKDSQIIEKISKSVRLSRQLMLDSESLYHKGQNLLESELGLDKLSYQKPVGYTAQLSEIEQSRRLDSEHFYPAFYNLVAHLPDHINLVPLGTQLNFCQRGKQPVYSKRGLPVVNSRHVQNNKIVLEGNRTAIPNPNTELQIRHGDILMNGTGRGTLGRVAPYLVDMQAIPDNHVTILRSPTLDPAYLSFYLNSQAGQLQVETHQRGTSGQLELYPFDIRKFLVWVAPEGFQKGIRNLYDQAAANEQQSKELLDQAKTRVQQLIEQAVHR